MIAERDYTGELCQFLADLALDKIPRAIVGRTQELIVDHVGVALAGSQQSSTRIVRDAMYACGGKPESTVYGSPDKISAPGAALINGTAAHSISLDDTHNESFSHPGAVVIPTAIALAEATGATAEHFLTAVVAGYEAQCRIGAAASTALPRGFHPTGVAGVFGAAAAAGHLLGLDAASLERAFGIALSSASGTMQFSHDPTANTKRLHAGLPAHAGIIAAQLARAGLRGPRAALHGPAGVTRVFAGEGEASKLADRLGESWAVGEISIKLHACCRFFHSAIDALQICRERIPFDARDVARVEVHGPAAALEGHMQYRPASTASAQYSLPYAMAATLLLDPGNPHSFGEQVIDRPELKALMDRVSAEVDPALERMLPDRFAGRVRVTLNDGRLIEEFRPDSLGTPEFPVGRSVIESKFQRLVSGIATREWQQRLVEHVLGLDSRGSLHGLTAMLRDVAPGTSAS